MRNILIPIALLLLSQLYGCGGRSSVVETEEFIKQVDSLLRPTDLPEIDRRMAQAADSSVYYVWMTQKSYIYATMGNDSGYLLAKKCVNYFNHTASTPRLKSFEATAWDILARGYAAKGMADSAETAFIKSYETSMASDDKRRAANQCSEAITIFANDQNKIGKWLRRGLFLADSLNMSLSKKNLLLTNLAILYQSVGDYDNAVKTMKDVYADIDSISNPTSRLYSVSIYGDLCNINNDYHKAYEVLSEGVSWAEKQGIGKEALPNIIRLNLADTYIHLDSTAKAKQMLDTAVVALKPIIDQTEQFQYYINTLLIDINVKENKLAEAAKIIQNAPKNSTEAVYKKNRMKALGNYYIKAGDYKSALANLEEFKEYEDSLKETYHHYQAEEMETAFRTDTLEMRKQMLEQEKKVSETRNILFFFIALATIIILGLILTVKSSKWKRLKEKGEKENMKLKLEKARSYISPHFILNVLNNEIDEAQKERESRLMQLVKLIRHNIDNAREEMVTLREELEFVNEYVELAKPMLGKEFTYNTIINDPNLLDTVKVPSMFIQNLVENAINHGLKAKQGEKRLTVSVKEEQGRALITVEDNGKGFDVRKSTAEKSSRLGLSIIRNSIALMNRFSETRQLDFDIINIKDDNKNITGCKSILYITINRVNDSEATE